MTRLFAALIVEREPSRWETLAAPLQDLQSWLEVAGGFALFGLIVFFLYRGLHLGSQTLVPSLGHSALPRIGAPYVVLFCGAAASYGVFLCIELLTWMRSGQRSLALTRIEGILLTAGGAFALLAVLLPVLLNMSRLRLRRIWALTRLSFKEAIRRKVLWGFSAFLLVILFASWFLPHKPEDQVRNYVRVVSWAMSPLLLVTAGMLAAFSIPTDLRSQTMHTIVTKPVERFEIVLGRCLGYILLMTLVLAVMSLLSLVYVARGIDKEAEQESYKARVPVFGNLIVEGGSSVGREWDYRQYLAGGASNARAIWTFPSVPSDLARRGLDTIPCEFAFDIFRTHKGRENRGVRCSFVFESWQWDVKNQNDYTEDRGWVLDHQTSELNEAEVRAEAARDNWPEEKTQRRLDLAQALRPIVARLAEVRKGDSVIPLDQRIAMLLSPLAQRYGYYELKSKEVFDYHTLSVAVPAGMFANLSQKAAGDLRPPLKISVRCEDPSQYLGVAKHDLYLLDRESSFAINFFKGAVGLWCRICLVIVVAVTLSTYFTGVISLLTTLLLYMGGLLIGFIKGVAAGKEAGGGPLESLIRLGKGAQLMAELEKTPALQVALILDEAFRFGLRLLLNIFPDVDRYDLTGYVSQGYDIPVTQLFVDGMVPLVGYTIPWLILGFFLIKSREIAT